MSAKKTISIHESALRAAGIDPSTCGKRVERAAELRLHGWQVARYYLDHLEDARCARQLTVMSRDPVMMDKVGNRLSIDYYITLEDAISWTEKLTLRSNLIPHSNRSTGRNQQTVENYRQVVQYLLEVIKQLLLRKWSLTDMAKKLLIKERINKNALGEVIKTMASERGEPTISRIDRYLDGKNKPEKK